MRYSLKEAFEDDIQAFDFRKTSGMSKRKLQTAFLNILVRPSPLSSSQIRPCLVSSSSSPSSSFPPLHFQTRKAQQNRTSIFSVSDMRQFARDAHLQVPDFDELLETLNLNNFILKKGNGLYQLQTV